MEKVYFINFKRFGVNVYGSYEEAENDLFDFFNTGLIRLKEDIQTQIVVADLLEVDYSKEGCKTNSALLYHEDEFDKDEFWYTYLEKAANEQIAFLRKYEEETFGKAKVFELHNVKKFKPALFMIPDEE
jgi:hypothetical protein